jgi:hypothetical protein
MQIEMQNTPSAPTFVGYTVNISNTKEFEMAKFVPHSTKQMEPKPGAPYATTYTKVTAAQRNRLQKHVDDIILELCEASVNQKCAAMERPLKGFPRSGAQPNYSALDIVADMQRQLASGKDIPSGMLGRWNRLFAEWPDVCIDFVDSLKPTTTFGSIYA